MNKERIYPNDRDPLWLECVKRFDLEVKAPPAEDTQAFYYRSTRGRLKATDYNWYLLTDQNIIVREKKIGEG